MIKNKTYYLLIPLLIFFNNTIFAQCPTSSVVTLSTSSIPNDCGGNGSITATFSPSGSGSNISLQLIKDGTILSAPVQPTSPHDFSNLQPGDYEVRVVCSINNSIVLKTQNITVGDSYIPISNASINLSNVCTNYTAGGTITVSNVTGGTAPYQYKFVLSNDPAFPETLGTYGNNNFTNVTEFGTYQIRIKDDCGSYKTFTISLNPTLPPVRFFWKSRDLCSSTQNQADFWYANNPTTGGSASITPYQNPGLRIKIQSDNASGAVLYDGVYTGSSFNYTPNATHTYYVTTTTACGQSVSYTHTLTESDNNPEFREFFPKASTSGCGASETMTIGSQMSGQYYWAYPITVTVRNSSGNTVYSTTLNFATSWTTGNLPLGNYTVTVADSCSPANSLTKNVTNPQNSGTPTLTVEGTYLWRCDVGAQTQTGTVQALVQIDGYIPDRANAVVKIVSPSPSNIGVNATYLPSEGLWGWANLSPGTYNVQVITGCTPQQTYNFQFTIGNNYLLQQILSSSGVSFCSGGGNITSNLVYNGSYQNIVELLNSTGTVIATSTSGNFSNIPAGNYITRLKITGCNGAGDYNISGSSITLTDSSSGPSISSSVGVICEDTNGNPLSTGSAYLDLNGVAPLTLQYKVSGSSNWTTINNASQNTVISGLTANTLYDLLLVDKCGGSIISTVNIKTMGTLNSSNTAHPCNGSPYALAIPYYSGATYSWTNPQGTIVSNSRTYSVANWDNSYNGTYIAKITWTNCVTRYVYLTLNSNQCGQPIADACYRNAITSTTPIPSMHGITSLSRAGKDVPEQDNWPMVRQSAHTVLESKSKGFVINRVATDATGQVPTSMIATPVEGMMIYDTTNNCLKIYDGTSWKCFTKADCPD